MTEDMPRKLPPFVNRQRTRFGKNLYYFRRGKGPRTPLPDPSSPEFEAAYTAALTGHTRAPAAKAGTGSMAWLIGQYRQSSAFLALSRATRKQRDTFYVKIIDHHGDEPYAATTKAGIAKARDRRAATPAQARNFLDAMRGLFGWAAESGFITVDPTIGVKNPPRKKGPGFPAWTMDDVAAYVACWPQGTVQWVWLHVLLYTGLRRGDAVRVGWQNVRDGVITLGTEKTDTEAFMVLLPELEHALKVGPTGDMVWICGKGGLPLTKESFGNQFGEACRAAGVNKSAHGLRKLLSAICAERGFTDAEMDAWFGWADGKMASHYRRSASRKAMAVNASDKIVNIQRPNLVTGLGAGAKNVIESMPKK